MCPRFATHSCLISIMSFSDLTQFQTNIPTPAVASHPPGRLHSFLPAGLSSPIQQDQCGPTRGQCDMRTESLAVPRPPVSPHPHVLAPAGTRSEACPFLLSIYLFCRKFVRPSPFRVHQVTAALTLPTSHSKQDRLCVTWVRPSALNHLFQTFGQMASLRQL